MAVLWKYTRTQSDTDAAAFIAAASITDSTQRSAIYGLVCGLKYTGLWSKMIAVYPIIGGTATTHKFNLMNPLDTDGAYRIVWNGTVTHNANGVTSNGSTGYGDTKISASSVLSLNSSHLTTYSRTNSSEDKGAIGCLTSTPNKFYILPKWSDGKFYVANGSASDDGIAIDNSLGFMCSSRISSTSVVGFKNGFKNITSTRVSTTNPSQNIYLCALNNNGAANYFSSRNYAFFSVGSGLTDTEAKYLNMLVQSYQTTLGRAI